MGLLIVVAVSCSLMQYFLAIDNFEWMVFALILSTGFVFASLFALLQVKEKHSVFHTGICGGIFALYLILLFYVDLTLLIDWNAVSEGEIQLTILQKMIKSDAAFWITFIVPFLYSSLSYIVRSKSEPKVS